MFWVKTVKTDHEGTMIKGIYDILNIFPIPHVGNVREMDMNL